MKLRRWTISAIECYERGCNCKNCPTKELIETRCHMKETVFELVRKFGAPPKELGDGTFNETKKMIINSIIDGAKDVEEIKKATGIKQPEVQIRKLRYHYEEKGFVNKNGKRIVQELIDFIRKIYADGAGAHAPHKEREINMYFDEDLKIEYHEKFTGLVDAIKKGFETQADIARESGINPNSICWFLKQLARDLKLETHNASGKQAVIDFVRGKLFEENKNHIEQTHDMVKTLTDQKDPEEEKEEAKELSPYAEREDSKSDNSQIEQLKNKIKQQSDEIFAMSANMKKLELLEKENKGLKAKIEELQDKTPDFGGIKNKIQTDILNLQNKLKAIETLEKELLV